MLLKGIIGAPAQEDYFLDQGRGLEIKGVIHQQGAKLVSRVRLFEKLSGKLIFDSVSDENGNYIFKKLTKRAYFVVAHHPASQFNAVIQDNVVPK